MKKLIALILTTLMIATLFAACGAKAPADVNSDLEAIKKAGKLVVGITDYEPMDYKDENGEWTGFDADMTRLLAKELGVEAEFVVIDWDMKIQELDSGNIDCIWNGMTLTDAVLAAMDCSAPYCENAQVIVVPAA